MKREGFTLIELLIVVAIIAILAAIAVPNFLESQTRAKVSRVMADMRTIATAIEAYTVDYNRPLPDALEWFMMTHVPLATTTSLNLLTTPVAYMTSIPQDPFAWRVEGAELRVFYVTPMGFGSLPDPPYNNPSDPAGFFYGPRSHYGWALDSRGPDGWRQYSLRALSTLPGFNGAGDVLYYDATNGTKSAGDIYYYGPGGGFNPPPVTSR